RKVMAGSRNAAGAVRDRAVRAGHAAADALTGTARSVARRVGNAGGMAADGVRDAAKGAGAALRRARGALGGLLGTHRRKDGK
ncbi:MAG: hypothetical protein J5838_03160, partial [Desulfovibrio sp.]|nr:hypothetical protein [Desulfovibrio sp.]